MEKRLLSTWLFLLCLVHGNAQVNGYAEVTAISSNVLMIGSQDETYDVFGSGDFVLIYQAQDNVVTDFSSTPSFGAVSSVESAGLYEILQVSSVSRSGGAISSITLNTAPSINFRFNTHSQVQVITFPTLGSPNYTTTSDIYALDWNGAYGGIIGFNVEHTLTLQHNIIADFAGFRGGAKNVGGTSSCDSTTYFNQQNAQFAYKGEGIYKRTSANYEGARGRLATGGGGGNPHNGGGGGGGNFSQGGLGGPGWGSGSTPCSRHAGGYGGAALKNDISSMRVFMGGGGGSGEGNNNKATAGGNGGGLIFIDADTIRTTGSCSGLTISANGQVITTGSGNDGAGGGGAGGSIVFNVDHFDINTTCPLTISANGGNGGDVTHQHPHGGGGGGGMGVIYFSIAEPSVGVTVSTDPGDGGLNRNNSSTDVAENGTGTPSVGEGVFDDENDIALPVELVYFAGQYRDSYVQLQWTTASELNNSHFEVWRKSHDSDWELAGHVEGNGTSLKTNHYNFSDRLGSEHEVMYYRLRQVDFDGTSNLSDVISLRIKDLTPHLSAYPNPANQEMYVTGIGLGEFQLFSQVGQLVAHGNLNVSNKIDLYHLPVGTYLLRVQSQVGPQSIPIRIAR